MAVTPIELLTNDGSETVLGHGTGFFWREGSNVALVTARHVISGEDPFSGELIPPHRYRPEWVKISPAILHSGTTTRLGELKLQVTADGQPLWAQDDQFGEYRVDIAAISLPALSDAAVEAHFNDPSAKLICLNEESEVLQPIVTRVGFECSVVGYPTALVGGFKTPVWRRATIASEPRLPVDGKPMFLLDASTSPGFSGAPVFRRHIGPLPIRQEGGEFTMDVGRMVTNSFIGVYAGRLQNQHFGGEVPFVFYGNRVAAIVARAHSGELASSC